MAIRIPGRGNPKRRRSDASPLESEIASRIMAALRTIGCSVSSTQQTRASRQTVGMPDLHVVHAAWGISAWMEVKRPGEKPSKAQLEWHTTTRAAGVHVLVVTSAADALTQFGALPRRRFNVPAAPDGAEESRK